MACIFLKIALSRRRHTRASEGRRPRIGVVFLFASLASALSLVAPPTAVTHARTQSESNQTTQAESALDRARRESDEAQAEYYRELTRKLREPTPTPTKTLKEHLEENPTPVLGVLGAVLAALFAALVGLLTLYVNSRNALRAQRDTQFYEALKRLGDKDSPPLRVSAAGQIAQMAATKTLSFKLWRRYGKRPERPYFHTAFDQLTVSLLHEENFFAVAALGRAISLLIPNKPDEFGVSAEDMIDDFVTISWLSQESSCILLAEFCALRGDKPKEEIALETWRRVEALFGYKQSHLESLISLHNFLFSSSFETYSLVYESIPQTKREELLLTIQQRLRVALARLYFATHLLRSALVKRSAEVSVQLKHAYLCRANLAGERLTRLELDHAKLNDARLHGATIDNSTSLKGANWWTANFYSPTTREVDGPLLAHLFRRYGASVPEDEDQWHPSVLAYSESQRQKRQADTVASQPAL